MFAYVLGSGGLSGSPAVATALNPLLFGRRMGADAVAAVTETAGFRFAISTRGVGLTNRGAALNNKKGTSLHASMLILLRRATGNQQPYHYNFAIITVSHCT